MSDGRKEPTPVPKGSLKPPPPPPPPDQGFREKRAIPELTKPITEDWLREVGFKWHQFERQPNKHWLLWLGRATEASGGVEDIGIEITDSSWRNAAGERVGYRPDDWNCWLRSDVAHRYSRFLHVRYLRYQSDAIRLIEAITGQEWNPENHFYGSVLTPQQAERERQERQRLDRRMLEQNPTWYEKEKDESRGRPLAEHQEKAEFGK